MCLIVFAADKKKLDWGVLERGFRANDDGWGIMFPIDGRIKVFRLYEPNVDKSWKVFKNLMEDKVPEGVKIAIHFRIKTHGSIANKNCHPFQILHKPTHGHDVYVMHNGTINGMDTRGPGDDRSDTAIFAQDYMTQILKGNPEFMYTKQFQKIVKELAGGWSRLLFMNGDGDHWIHNESGGTKQDEVWYSNSGALYDPKKTSGSTNSTGSNHHRGRNWSDYGYGSVYSQHHNAYVRRDSKKNPTMDDIFTTMGFERQEDGLWLLKGSKKPTDLVSAHKEVLKSTGVVVNLSVPNVTASTGTNDSDDVALVEASKKSADSLSEHFMMAWMRNLSSLAEPEVYHALIEYPTMAREYMYNHGLYANRLILDIFVDKYPELASKWIYHRSRSQIDKLNQIDAELKEALGKCKKALEETLLNENVA